MATLPPGCSNIPKYLLDNSGGPPLLNSDWVKQCTTPTPSPTPSPTSTPTPTPAKQAGCPTGNCCEFENALEEIRKPTTIWGTSTQISSWNIKFQLHVNLGKGRPVMGEADEVNVVVRVRPASMAMKYSWSPKQNEVYFIDIQDKLSSIFDDKFKLILTSGTCPERKLSVKFHIIEDKSSPHYNLKAGAIRNPGEWFWSDRSHFDGENIVLFQEDTYNYVVTVHEYGHAIGLHDEYTYEDRGHKNVTITYQIPNEGPHSINASPFAQAGTNLMNDISKGIEYWHYVTVATEAQRIIRKQNGNNAIVKIEH